MLMRRSEVKAQRSRNRSQALPLGVLLLRILAALMLSLTISGIVMILLSRDANAQQPSAGNKVLVAEIVGSETIDLIQADGKLEKIGAGAELRVGNKISTEQGVLAKLRIFDGSEFNLGQNSEFLVEDRKANKSVGAQWNFKLLRGAVHGIATKTEERKLAANNVKDVKIKIRTKSAVMGIRGTNFVYTFSPVRSRTEHYTNEGEVEFSKSNELSPEKTVIVRGGEWSYADGSMSHPREPEAIDYDSQMQQILVRHGFVQAESVKKKEEQEDLALHTIEECLQKQFKGWRHKDGERPHLGICYK